jgi:hypothetical protein
LFWIEQIHLKFFRHTNLFDDFAGFWVQFPALELSGDNMHSLLVLVVVNRDFSGRTNREKSQPIGRRTGGISADFREPANAYRFGFGRSPLIADRSTFTSSTSLDFIAVIVVSRLPE